MASVDSIIQGSMSSTVQHVFPRNPGRYGMLFMFTDYNYSQTRATITDADIGKYQGSIILPLPKEGLTENSSFNIKETDLGIGGASIADFADRSMNGNFNGISDFYSAASVAGGLAAMLPLLSSAVDKMGKGAAIAALTGGDAIKGLSAGSGLALNDFQSLTFDGVNLRNHTFSWTLYPESPSDSVIINAIKKKFQAAAHPNYNSVGANSESSVSSRILFRYPQMVLPVILIGNDAEYYYHFKPCLIKKVNLAYKGDAGMSFMKGGAPASVELQIELVESGIWTSDDYQRTGQRGLDTDLTTMGSNLANAAGNFATSLLGGRP